MSAASISSTQGGASILHAQDWLVKNPSARGFQTVFYLTFEVDEGSDGVLIDESACRLTATFSPLTYNALSAAPIPAATLRASKDNNAVIATLDAPRQVVDVQLQPSGTVELHRADGLVQADKAADSTAFTDVNFAIVRQGGSIAANQVKAIHVRATPGNVRMAIADPQVVSPAMFWPTPDSVGKLSIDASAPFAKALQAYVLATWSQALKASQQKPATPKPQQIVAALIIQSDGPCQAKLSHFAVAYHQALTSFASHITQKQVLRYAGKRVDRQSVSIQLPGAATVASGSIRVQESFHPGGASGSQDLLSGGDITGNAGVRISAADTESAGQRVMLSAPMAVPGIALGLMAVLPATEISLQVQTDWQGLPSGKTIASCAATLQQAGRMQWAILSFKDAVTLPTGPVWILVSATKGAAVWLVEQGDDPPGLLQFEAGAWTQATRLQGYTAVYRLLPPPTSALAPGGETSPSVELVIGTQKVNGALQSDGSRLFDIASATNAFLTASHPAKAPVTPAEVKLVFASGSAGSLSIYPPNLAYSRTNS
jgi:hypothetical protein